MKRDTHVPAETAQSIDLTKNGTPFETGSPIFMRYAALAEEFGSPVARRVQALATVQQKRQLAALAPRQTTATELAVDAIESVLSHAPGNGELIGGIKVTTATGWFAARPSGTESVYKIYAERFRGTDPLQHILQEAQAIVDAAISPRVECYVDA